MRFFVICPSFLLNNNHDDDNNNKNCGAQLRWAQYVVLERLQTNGYLATKQRNTSSSTKIHQIHHTKYQRRVWTKMRKWRANGRGHWIIRDLETAFEAGLEHFEQRYSCKKKGQTNFKWFGLKKKEESVCRTILVWCMTEIGTSMSEPTFHWVVGRPCVWRHR